MWLDNWNDVLRAALVGAAAYVVLVLVLLASGKRTLAKLLVLPRAIGTPC